MSDENSPSLPPSTPPSTPVLSSVLSPPDPPLPTVFIRCLTSTKWYDAYNYLLKHPGLQQVDVCYHNTGDWAYVLIRRPSLSGDTDQFFCQTCQNGILVQEDVLYVED